tara:strand:- start:64 stop:801 length:738 start_codon:yes stop_codon:yes gene_type:complete
MLSLFLASSASTSSAEPAGRGINCTEALGVDGMHDGVPVRTAIAVMEHVAWLAKGRSFVEVGSRHGDLIECVSHVTTSAVSVEASKFYCPELAKRAAASSGRWSSMCAVFSAETRGLPRAQLFFTWIQHYFVVAFLASMHALQRQGAVATDTEFAFNFAGPEHPPERHCWNALRIFATRYSDVPYHEHNGKRGRGKFTVGVFQPSHLNMSAVDAAARGICHKGSALALLSSSATYSAASADARLG